MPRFSVLESVEIEQIHSAALEVLKRVGCRIKDNRWLELLDNNDLSVDYSSQVVKIPSEHFITSAIESCGHEIKLLARNSAFDFKLGEGYPKAHTPEGMTHIIDYNTNRRREANLTDLIELTKVCDALPNIDAIMCPVVAQDVPPVLQSLLSTVEMIKNTSKPITPGGAALGRAFPYIAQIILALVDDRPLSEYSLGVGVTATSPLEFPKDQLDAYWEGTELGTPCSIGSMPQAGSTAPAPLTGMLVQYTAEILMGLVMGQIKSPGLPQFVYVRTCVINPRYGIFNSGNPEVGLIQAAATQLFKQKYKLPVNSGWAVSDAHVLDPQATYEKVYTWLMTMFTGADMVSGVGGLSSGLTASLIQVILDNELIGHVRRAFNGLVSSTDQIVDMIEEVGIGGTFLSHRKTGEILRQERWFSDIFNRDSYEIWLKKGEYTSLDSSKEKVKLILENHTPEPLHPDLQEIIDEVVKEAKHELI